MRRRRLGRTGLEVSVVGFGGIPIQGVSAAEADRIVGRALDLGIDFFDTARAYTDSEEKIGRALGARRGRVAIATKSLARDAASMAKDVETSLRTLGVDVIDLYQVHSVGSVADLERVLGPGGACEALSDARARGLVRFVGISSHSRAVLLQAVRSGAFDTVQLPLNPFETEWLDDVVPAARAADIGVIAMKPAAGGAIRRVPASLRFVLSHGADVAIPGMDSVSQVEENAAAGDLEPSSDEDLRFFEAEKARWGKVFCRRCGYCTPCPNGLAIPFLFLIEAYYTRYGLRDWALDRLAGLDKRYADCQGCGECATRCPYGLPIPDLMSRAAETVK